MQKTRVQAVLLDLLPYHATDLGEIHLGDSLSLMKRMAAASVDLIVTSPPFGLVRKKSYGNVDAEEYVAWFEPFGAEFLRVLKPTGSLVIDIGGSWNPGQPTRSLYHFDLLIMLCRKCGFHLAQEFFWWNPARLPTPAEWVTVRRIRVKDAVDCIWWLSPTPWPRASNRRVLVPYSDAMVSLLRNGYRAKLRPSGHDISSKFSVNNGAAIPPNLIAVANTESNSHYLRFCAEKGLKPHPARFPSELPGFFIRFLTDRGDVVLDPFAGSCVTGEVCERLGRRWVCIEMVADHLKAALGRFAVGAGELFAAGSGVPETAVQYYVHHPNSIPAKEGDTKLPLDGGRTRASAALHEEEAPYAGGRRRGARQGRSRGRP